MNNKNEFSNLLSECKSMLCKHLSTEIYEKLKHTKTANNFSLDDAIRSGIENPDSSIGVYAGDEDSYTLFAPLFDPIIQEYHGFTPQASHQSNMNPHDLHASNPDPEGKYILSTRIRVGRNIAKMPLGTAISRTQRTEVEAMVVKSLKGLKGSLAGDYYPLLGMTKEVQDALIEDHFLFKEGDRFLASAGLNRDWPEGRGIYHNQDKTFLVWVNEEDQLRIISMQKGGDIQSVFERLVTAVAELEKELAFAYNSHIGYITSCPTNLGTAMRASVHIALPKLGKNKEAFEAITNTYHLQIRGVHGEHSESEGGIYDISNQRRLGITEVACVQEMYEGVVALIKAEESL